MAVHSAEGRAAKDRATTSAAPNRPNGLGKHKRISSMSRGVALTVPPGADSSAVLSMFLDGVT